MMTYRILTAAAFALTLAAPAFGQQVVPETPSLTKSGAEGVQWNRETGTIKTKDGTGNREPANLVVTIPMDCGELGLGGNPAPDGVRTSAGKPCFRIVQNHGFANYQVISIDDSCLAPVNPMTATVTLSNDRVVTYTVRDDDRWWKCDGTEVTE